jgi:prepilin-type N-terminal cleavage/methylation domain-containing protein
MTKSSHGHPAGFTLLEILIALAILGFILLSLGQGLRFGLTAWGIQ